MGIVEFFKKIGSKDLFVFIEFIAVSFIFVLFLSVMVYLGVNDGGRVCGPMPWYFESYECPIPLRYYDGTTFISIFSAFFILYAIIVCTWFSYLILVEFFRKRNVDRI